MSNFKKLFILIAIITLITMSFVYSDVSSDKSIHVTVDGRNIDFDVPPISIDGATFVPIAPIFNALGADVMWNGSTKTVTATKDDIKVSLKLNEKTAYVNGKKIIMDRPCFAKDGRTLIHTRFVAQSLGAQITWVNESRTVKINNNSKDSETYKKAKEIIEKYITADMTEYEKEKVIHDYLVNNIQYDNTFSQSSYSAYGALIKGRAVCQGYAEAAELLFFICGIDSYVATGDADNGSGLQGHAWNIVKIDGDYYHLDITWDDPISSTGENILRYDYFNLTDKEMSKDHRWEPVANISCTSDKYNYFNYNNMRIESQNDLKEAIKNNILNKNYKMTYKTTDFIITNEDLKNMIVNIMKELRIFSYSYSYYSDIDTKVIEVEIKTLSSEAILLSEKLAV